MANLVQWNNHNMVPQPPLGYTFFQKSVYIKNIEKHINLKQRLFKSIFFSFTMEMSKTVTHILKHSPDQSQAAASQ